MSIEVSTSFRKLLLKFHREIYVCSLNCATIYINKIVWQNRKKYSHFWHGRAFAMIIYGWCCAGMTNAPGEYIKCENNNVKNFCLMCKRGKLCIWKSPIAGVRGKKARFHLKSRTWDKSMPFNIYMLIVFHTPTHDSVCLSWLETSWIFHLPVLFVVLRAKSFSFFLR